MVAQTGQKVFGAGRFWGIPSTTNPTVSPFGVAQDVTLDFKRDIKKLFGQNQLPVDAAAGMLSVTGKVNMGVINGRLINDLMIGGTLSTGQVPYIADESGTVAGTTVGAGTVTAANGAGFQTDLGVYWSSSGIPLTRVSTASTPATGQYNVVAATGVYTFSSLDGNVAVKLSYLYSTVGGQNVAMTNQPMGTIGKFQAVMGWLWGTEKATVNLAACIGSDISYATKLDDYMKPGFGFEAFCDANNSLGTMSFAEIN